MPNVTRRALAAGAALAACSSGSSTTAPASLAGAYQATTFRAAPSGQAAVDVLAAGGSLTVIVGLDNGTTGTLSVPPALNGGTPLTVSMAGTAARTGNTVRFTQSADSFVRDLAWTVSGSTLTVTDQAAGSARFTITLTRQ